MASSAGNEKILKFCKGTALEWGVPRSVRVVRQGETVEVSPWESGHAVKGRVTNVLCFEAITEEEIFAKERILVPTDGEKKRLIPWSEIPKLIHRVLKIQGKDDPRILELIEEFGYLRKPRFNFYEHPAICAFDATSDWTTLQDSIRHVLKSLREGRSDLCARLADGMRTARFEVKPLELPSRAIISYHRPLDLYSAAMRTLEASAITIRSGVDKALQLQQCLYCGKWDFRYSEVSPMSRRQEDGRFYHRQCYDNEQERERRQRIAAAKGEDIKPRPGARKHGPFD